jgi:uncharacterized membrane protein (Fun14 family)
MDPGVLLNLSGGAVAGIAVGLALKTALRWALIFLGLCILGLVMLMKTGIIVIQWDALTQGLEAGVATIGGFIKLAVADLSAQLVGFAGGMVLGFKWR